MMYRELRSLLRALIAPPVKITTAAYAEHGGSQIENAHTVQKDFLIFYGGVTTLDGREHTAIEGGVGQ